MGVLGAEGLVALALFVFWIWALFDCVATQAARCRNLPKVAWLILVVLFADLGALGWLLFGRPRRTSGAADALDASRSDPPLGLEDQPRSVPTAVITDRRSAELDRRLDEWERQQAELRTHEQGLDTP